MRQTEILLSSSLILMLSEYIIVHQHYRNPGSAKERGMTVERVRKEVTRGVGTGEATVIESPS